MHKAETMQSDAKLFNYWIEYLKIKQTILGITPNCVGNFDETNMYFLPNMKSPVKGVEFKTMSVHEPNSNAYISVKLGSTLESKKFDLLVLYKGTNAFHHGMVAKNEICHKQWIPCWYALCSTAICINGQDHDT